MDEVAVIKGLIRDVPDFPKPGIIFKDITPLLRHPKGLQTTLDLLSKPFEGVGITQVVGMESRGFIFGVPVAERLGAGFVPVRKPGKLPAETIKEEYALEYGTDCLEMHTDALDAADKVLVVDDLLATGGTAAATVRMVRATGAAVLGAAFVIELGFLNGRSQLVDLNVTSLITF
ncbi:MAG: adenine phosphoribosyltransferase [Myxococcota bacterium]|nr:adenine phosphoribosyltransferase [Myxococcota bacterium]